MQNEVPEQLGQLLDDLELAVYLMQSAQCLFLGGLLAEVVGPGAPPGDPVVNACHPEDKAPLTEALAELATTGKPFTMTVRLGSDAVSWRTVTGRWAALTSDRDPIVVGALSVEPQRPTVDQERIEKLSHDLRTPLNAVLGYAQLLGLNDLPADQRSSLDQIMAGGRRLLGVIEGMERD